jgi:hypothetical protein
MKHILFGKGALTTLLVTMLIGTLVGCGPDKLVLESIVVTNPPKKSTYDIGQVLDLRGLIVTGTYSDGTTKMETVDIANVRGYNAYATGEQTLTVTVNGKTASFIVTVNAAGVATLQSIAVTSPPTKTVYTRGEDLDLRGLEVTGTYSDGITQMESVYSSNVAGYDANAIGTQTVTVTIDGKTAFFVVIVNAAGVATLQSIAVTSPPTKTIYTRGEDLDLSGLEVTGTYSDNSTKAEFVSASDISGYDPDTTGRQTLVVAVNGNIAFFVVTVNAAGIATLQSIAVTSPPTKTVYTRGEDLDLRGLEVTGTYSDGTTKTESVYSSNVAGYDANAIGTQTLTITIDGKTVDFTVKVQATASLIVNFDSPINGVQEDIALSKTGTPSFIVLEIAGTYADYEWRLNDNDEPVSRDASYTLNAADCPLGKNFLDVQVRTSSGTYYSKEITFIVNK